MENRNSGTERGQLEHFAQMQLRMQEAVTTFKAAPKEQPISDMQVVIPYMASVERVEHFTRGGEHVFRFNRRSKDNPERFEWDELPRNAHAIRDEFLKIEHPIEALDFLSNTGRFSPLSLDLTWSEFQRWQRFARLVQLHTPLMTATIEGQRSGECVEVLKALTGESVFHSSFFDGCKIPQTPEMAEFDARMMREHPEIIPDIQEGRRLQERLHRELCSWFHQPPVTIEWVPCSEEAEQRAIQQLQNKGFGPWMMDFLLPKKELRPVIVIRPAYTLQAIAAAIYVDRIKGVEWRKCKREKCPETFRVGAREKQKWCSTTCRENDRSYNKRHRRKTESE